MVATTATANDRVVQDVVAQLGDDLELLRGPLDRQSLRLQTLHLPSQAARLAWLSRHVSQLPGSGIIYTLTIRDAERVAEWLQHRGINARAYWGELATDQREFLEQALLDNRVKALVATTALGMGFDKPDLGFVIHFQRPGSVIHYYQQIGRAGRALEDAYAILLAGSEDSSITRYFIDTAFPPAAHAQQILFALEHTDDGLSTPMLEEVVNLSRSQVERTLKYLATESPSPVMRIKNRWFLSPFDYIPDQDRVSKIIKMRYEEQQRMQDYLVSSECLMVFLLRELGEVEPKPCGRCAICHGAPLLSETYSPEEADGAVRFLRRRKYEIVPRRQWPGKALLERGWTGRITAPQRHETGRVLCLWGDDGWGTLVRDGKLTANRFDDELVEAAAQLIRELWSPRPFPSWVTCVPSLERVDLVPDFAHRLAQRLQLPFVTCVRKTRHTEPQKSMNNSYQQVRNLDRAFVVQSWPGISGPVLLVDDIVDSRWTFTVIAAELRAAGSGPVYPFALADASRA